MLGAAELFGGLFDFGDFAMRIDSCHYIIARLYYDYDCNYIDDDSE